LDLDCVRAKSVRCGSIDERREQDEPDLTIQLARASFRLVDTHVRCNHKGIFQPQPAPTCDCIRDSPSQQQRRDNCQRYSHPLQILPLSFVRGQIIVGDGHIALASAKSPTRSNELRS
jgi:hypothetical protein